MNPNDNNINYVFYDSDGNPIAKIEPLNAETLASSSPAPIAPIITPEEEFSCTLNLTEESSAALWAFFEGLEIVDGGNNNV